MYYFILYFVLLAVLGGSLGYIIAKAFEVYAMAHRSGVSASLLWTIMYMTVMSTVVFGLLIRWF